MFDKFEGFLNKTLVPIAEKMDKQSHLSAVKSAMVALIPFTILGSIFAIFPAIANMLPEDFVITVFINDNRTLWDIAVSLSIGMMSIYTIIGIATSLAKHYKLFIPGCVGLSIFAFLFIAVDSLDNGISMDNLGAKGLFCAMFSAIIATEIYHFCIKKKITVRMPDGVPDFVSKSFEAIPIILVISAVFVTIRILSDLFFGTLPPQLLTVVFQPLITSMDNPFVCLGVFFMCCLLFFFGIHPSVISSVTAPIAATYIAENIAAQAAGEPLMHFYTAGTHSAFVNFTGTGVTIGLVICFMLSKSKTYKKLGKVAIFPSLFGINEPVIFGLPVMLNPIMFVPYVVGGAIVGVIPLFCMYFGWLNMPFFNPPYVGVFLEGFLTNMDWRDVIVQAIQVVLSFAIYFPFFKILERKQLESEEKNSTKSGYEFSQLDLALLGDIDF